MNGKLKWALKNIVFLLIDKLKHLVFYITIESYRKIARFEAGVVKFFIIYSKLSLSLRLFYVFLRCMLLCEIKGICSKEIC